LGWVNHQGEDEEEEEEEEEEDEEKEKEECVQLANNRLGFASTWSSS
jgi:CO dehydrogenase/acetyl-CoA synthase beta subunit